MKAIKLIKSKNLTRAIVCGLLATGALCCVSNAYAANYINDDAKLMKLDKRTNMWIAAGDTLNVISAETVPAGYKEYKGGVVTGGFSDTASLTGKKVTITDGGSVNFDAYGVMCVNGNASHNTVTVKNGKVGDDAYGAICEDGTASENSVILNGGVLGQDVYGGSSENGKAIRNRVTINSGRVVQDIYGGYSGKNSAIGNIVTINGGSVGGLWGGKSEIGDASNNVIIIKNAKITPTEVNAGQGRRANNNVLIIADSSVESMTLIGGFSKHSKGIAKDNAIVLVGKNGSFKYVSDDKTFTTTVKGTKGSTIKGIITVGDAKTTVDNRLDVYGTGTVVDAVYANSTQKLNFYVQDGLVNGSTMLKVKDFIDLQDFASVTLNASVKDVNKSIILVSCDTGVNADVNKIEKNTGFVDCELNADQNKVTASFKAKSSDAIIDAGLASEATGDMVSDIFQNVAAFETNEKTKNMTLFAEKMQSAVVPPLTDAVKANVNAAISGIFLAGETVGATSTAVSVINNVANLTANHMSLADAIDGADHMSDSREAGVWVQYVHGKDKSNGLAMDSGLAKYSNSFNGVVVGADFKRIDKFQSGVAFSYVNGKGANSFVDNLGSVARYGNTDFKNYGFTYYGSIKNASTNTIFDVNYNRGQAEARTDGTGGTQAFTAKTNTWSAGVTMEKALVGVKNAVQSIPYAGVRYMHIDTRDYRDSFGFRHASDKQNVVILPVGIKLLKENKAKHGWHFTPKVDLAYVWALGDTDSKMTVSAPGVSSISKLGYEIMDKGSFFGNVGIEAAKSNWSYGLSYSYQKGDKQESKKLYAEVKFKF